MRFVIQRSLKKSPNHRTRLMNIFIVMLLGITSGFQMHATAANGPHVDEYGVKAAFIFNFLTFTQWPDTNSQTINLCIYGEDYFGREIDRLQQRSVNNAAINVVRLNEIEKVQACQVLFISRSAIGDLHSILAKTNKNPILTIADSPGAADKGVIINMSLVQNKIKFEINLVSAVQANLQISSKLLQLATQVYR